MIEMNEKEQALATDAQKGLNAAKKALRDAMKATRALMEIQDRAGRNQEYAAAYKTWVAMDAALNGVHRAHSVGTEAMSENYSNGGIVLYGGGGGR
jgi:hypothetical protein